MLIAFVFGLFHGLGFAAVLAEIGLPEQQIVTALLFFNLGVEAGQLIFIAVVMLFALLIIKFKPHNLNVLRNKVVKPASYMCGTLGSFWALQRIWQLFV